MCQSLFQPRLKFFHAVTWDFSAQVAQTGLKLYSHNREPGVAPEGATAPPSGNLSPPVREKLTICQGIFTDKHTYILHEL